MSHITFTLLLAALLAAAIAFSENRRPLESFCRAVYLYLYSLGLVAAGSWAMRWIHG